MINRGRNYPFAIFFFSILLMIGCQSEPAKPAIIESPSTSSNNNTAKSYGATTFKLVNPQSSGVTFSNEIKEDYNYNILNFEYLYNGGGVAVGDINNDGLADLYFVGNFTSNKLYLNKGNMKFEDITEAAGVAAMKGFKTGVTMADINADGWLDIYVCRTDKNPTGDKDNLVFLNNKNNTFTESAAALGLKDNSNSNHATFFDYDLDGDLDMYLLNHRLGFKEAVKMRLKQSKSGKITREKDPLTPYESDRLYQNMGNGKFSDVSQKAGIINSSFGLSATVGDLNGDGYPDVYVANDYIEPDYVYINNKNGTFTDQYDNYLRHSSQNTMGADVADYNNDGLLDIITLDMVAEEPERYKRLMNVMQTERYETLVKYGYGHQAGRNVLQLNNGNNTFSEVGQLAGVSNTDWSWGAFLADLDNDGWKDLYVANGYRRDVTDLDYMTYLRDSIERTGGINNKRFPDLNTFLDLLPEYEYQNYTYRNNGELQFDDVTSDWGFNTKSYSNGSAFADLDNDGDLDIIVNNIEQPSFIYENLSANKNYIQLKLVGPSNNKFAYGTKVRIYNGDQMQHQELTASRSFYSSSDCILHFGLGNKTDIDKIEVQWPNGKSTTLQNVKGNQRLEVDIAKANGKQLNWKQKSTPLFKETTASNGITFQHKENDFLDFNRERLLPHKLSRLGPDIAVGDVNGDGMEDFYIGGALNSSGALMIQKANGKFVPISTSTWAADAQYEDVGAVFFDVDQDGDADLYVVSGGYAENAASSKYIDRLYTNDGKGVFTKSSNISVPAISAACASAHDFDGDGDEDIFVGGRVMPGKYPTIANSYVLQNDNGSLKEVTSNVAPTFQKAGMVTDIKWVNVDGEPDKEMIVVGEWMPITIYKVRGGKLEDITSSAGLGKTNGWWNCVNTGDFDGDGDIDIVAGNLGKNTRLKASEKSPLKIFAKDFDNNGAIDPILAFTKNGKTYPYAGRDMLIKQVSKIKKKFPRYVNYSNATVEEVFSPNEIRSALNLEVYQLASCYFENNGNGNFIAKQLPIEAQVAPCHDILNDDFNKDCHLDLLLVGNDKGAETETGVYDASNGVVLLGNGKGAFKISPNFENGMWAADECRSVEKVQKKNGKSLYLIGVNNGKMKAFETVKNK